jgi:hypothetical protein
MEKKRISCSDAREWINQELDSRPATRGMRVRSFSKYDPRMEPPEVLEAGHPGLDFITSNTVRHLWRKMGEEFEIEPDLGP